MLMRMDQNVAAERNQRSQLTLRHRDCLRALRAGAGLSWEQDLKYYEAFADGLINSQPV